ncbi:MAG: hypothetical protein ACR2LE_07240 [Nocardioidaceae bacterium]
MSRRVRLPGADELFRRTGADPDAPAGSGGLDPESLVSEYAAPTTGDSAAEDAAAESTPGPSGRVRHDEKITVYVTSDELIDLEQTRLALRREHGLAVDRGRIVREAINLALRSVEAEGEASPLVRRLHER